MSLAEQLSPYARFFCCINPHAPEEPKEESLPELISSLDDEAKLRLLSLKTAIIEDYMNNLSYKEMQLKHQFSVPILRTYVAKWAKEDGLSLRERQSPLNKKVCKFIETYYKKHGELPGSREIRDQFPGYTVGKAHCQLKKVKAKLNLE